MNLCKERINNRTKSLREKFSRNRSYSELSFAKEALPPAPSSPLLSSNISHRIDTSGSRLENRKGLLQQQHQQHHRPPPQVPSASDFHFQNESYCSALDLSVAPYDGSQPRFLWQQDAAVQCDLISATPASAVPPPPAKKLLCPSQSHSTATSFINAAFSSCGAVNARFWKSSHLLPSSLVSGVGEKESSNGRSFRRHKWTSASMVRRPALKRAASFDSRGGSGGYARLVQSTSSPSSPPDESTLPVTAGFPIVDSIINKVATSHPTVASALTAAAAVTPMRQELRQRQFFSRKQPSSAPDSFDDDGNGVSPPASAKKRLNVTSQLANGSNGSGVSPNDELYNYNTVNRLLNISLGGSGLSASYSGLAGTASSAAAARKDSKSMMMLDLPTTGRSANSYQNLPSPNIQSEIQEVNPVLRKLSVLSRSPQRALGNYKNKCYDDSFLDYYDDDELPDEEAPTGQHRHRRRALVPPKLITDDFAEPPEITRKPSGGSPADHRARSTDDRSSSGNASPGPTGKTSPNSGSGNSHLSAGTGNRNRRRSSVVVIPPMQICPGDLLVYSKVLTQRANMIEGSLTASLLQEQDQRKAHKSNTWSLLRLFDRSGHRNKTDQILCGLEEVLSNLQPSNHFHDETLLRFRGIPWNEFCQRMERRRKSNDISSGASIAVAVGGITSGSRFLNNARLSSLQSTVLDGGSNNNNCLACRRNNNPTIAVGGMAKTASYNQDRLKDSSIDLPELQRADSANTISEVESICDDVVFHGEEESESDTFCCECLQNLKREKRRREALWELLQSELFFLTDYLCVLKNVFMEPLKSIQVEGYAMFAEPEVLFGNLDELCLVTYAFCREFLNTLIAQQSTTGQVMVTEVLTKLYLKNDRAATMAQAYHRYTLNYINALTFLETLRRQLEFSEFEKWCNRDPRCKKLQLTDLLVAPVQHVMRVPLLLKEIAHRTHDPDEKKIIDNIIEQQELSLRELDDKMRWLKNFERLLEIQRNIIWPSVLDMDPKVFVPDFLKSFLAKQPCERLVVSPRRQVVLEGPLAVLDTGKAQEMYVFLFDDLLLITRRKKSLGKKQSTLTERWVTNCSGRNSSFSTGSTGSGTASVGSPVTTVTVNPNAGVTAGAAATAAATVAAGPAMAAGNQPPPATATVVAATTAATAAAVAATASQVLHLGEPHHGPLSGGGTVQPMKYVVYKQPLSLDRFYIHDVPAGHETASLRNTFVLVCLNRFQQVITVHTFQAASESAKNTWLSKLRYTCDRWKRTLQSNAFRTNPSGAKQTGNNSNSKNPNRTPQPPPPTPATVKKSTDKPRDSIGSISINSSVSVRDNVSCSYRMEDEDGGDQHSILTSSTFT